jgi:hypothetical protein
MITTCTTGGSCGVPAGEPDRLGQLVLAGLTIGELLDKLSIARIKFKGCPSEVSENRHTQLTALVQAVFNTQGMVTPIQAPTSIGAVGCDILERINEALYMLENAVRSEEAVGLAEYRQITVLNDLRHAVKRAIDKAVGQSEYTDTKQYGASVSPVPAVRR